MSCFQASVRTIAYSSSWLWPPCDISFKVSGFSVSRAWTILTMWAFFPLIAAALLACRCGERNWISVQFSDGDWEICLKSPFDRALFKAPWHRNRTSCLFLAHCASHCWLIHTCSHQMTNWWVQPPQHPDLFNGPWTLRRGEEREQGRSWPGFKSVGEIIELICKAFHPYCQPGPDSWCLQLQLPSCQVSRCQCLWPWQAAQVSHSGSSAPSGTSALVPMGSQSARRHSPITPLKPSTPRSLGSLMWSSLLCVHWARTSKLCQWSHNPAFTLNANYNTPTATVLLLFLWEKKDLEDRWPIRADL